MPDKFATYGFSNQMGPKLRKLVEQQLLEDLSHYRISQKGLNFDWSASCLEGHSANHLDGSLENFSGIIFLNEDNAIIAEGWMDFILEGEFFLVYWDNLVTWEADKQIANKQHFGIPPHIWKKIPTDFRISYEKERML